MARRHEPRVDSPLSPWSLDPLRDSGQGIEGENQQVNVIRHDHPGFEFVEPLHARAGAKGVCDLKGYLGVGAPWRSLTLDQCPVHRGESLSWRRKDHVRLRRGKRATQTPSHEEMGSFGLDVRQSAAIFGHFGGWLSGKLKHAPQYKRMDFPTLATGWYRSSHANARSRRPRCCAAIQP